MKKLFFLILSLLIVPYLGKGQDIHIYHMEFGHRDEYSSTKYIATSSRKLIEDQNTRATNSYPLWTQFVLLITRFTHTHPQRFTLLNLGKRKKNGELSIIFNYQNLIPQNMPTTSC